jgi:protein TonB
MPLTALPAEFHQRLLQSRPPRSVYLPWAVLASALIHGAALAIHFGAAKPAQATLRSALDIVLVNTRTETAPLQPQALAQHDLNAGGGQAEGMAVSPLPHDPAQPAQDVALQATQERQAELEQEQERLLLQLRAQARVAAGQAGSGDAREADAPGEDDAAQEVQALQGRAAALEARVEHYNARPRQRFTGPSTLASEDAAYVESWRKRIEALGTRYYPEQARGQVYGSLQLTVYIQRDGQLAGIEINRPSEHAILNQAAQRIVRLAAPFAPLPAAIAARTDVLAISRTWHFTRDQLQTTAP